MNNPCSENSLGLIHELSIRLEKYILERKVTSFFETKVCPRRRVEAERLYFECWKLEQKAKGLFVISSKSYELAASLNNLRAMLVDNYWVGGQCYLIHF